MPLPFDPPLSTPELLAAFSGLRDVSPLGTGGQGAVFSALLGSNRVVLKLFSPSTVTLRVDREIEKLLRVSSPFVVQVYQQGVVQLRGIETRFTVMEFVEGGDLTTPAARFTDLETRALIHDMVRAIDAVWQVNVVHRDIKPANILRRINGRFCLIDLGMARHLDESTMTQAGWACGTVGYMSPEQATGRRALTFRSDLFALGLVAFEKASGLHPYQRQQGQIGRVPPPPLQIVAPHIAPSTARLILALLTPNAMLRPTCTQVLAATGSF